MQMRSMVWIVRGHIESGPRILSGITLWALLGSPEILTSYVCIGVKCLQNADNAEKFSRSAKRDSRCRALTDNPTSLLLLSTVSLPPQGLRAYVRRAYPDK